MDERGSESVVPLDYAHLEKMVQKSRNVVQVLKNGLRNMISGKKVEIIEAEAFFKDKNTLVLKSREKEGEITARSIVIATGALPRMIPGVAPELIREGLVWTSTEALDPPFLPKRLLVIGSGAIGIEFSSFYNALGVVVTVLEMQDRILLQEDFEVSRFAQKEMAKQGIKFVLSSLVKELVAKDKVVVAKIENSLNHATEEIEVDAVIVAVGVVPNTGSLNLNAVGVQTNPNGSIVVGEYQETTQSGIYAIGDVASTPWLAHKATREGIIAAERAAGLAGVMPLNPRAIPACVYANPEVASIGLSEEGAMEAGLQFEVGKSFFKGNGKAMADEAGLGFVKVIIEKNTGEILGAHIVGKEITELISVFSVAISGELTAKELAYTIFPHPTMSECIQEAVLDAMWK
jgi:dihydrolipoamide dehydrogenase